MCTTHIQHLNESVDATQNTQPFYYMQCCFRQAYVIQKITHHITVITLLARRRYIFCSKW